jgi:hypothetical protein
MEIALMNTIAAKSDKRAARKLKKRKVNIIPLLF